MQTVFEFGFSIHKIPGNASFPIRIAIPVLEIIIYLVLEENGYTPKNGVFNRPFFSLS